MRIAIENQTDRPIPISDFLRLGEYDQNDVALVEYDDLHDSLLRPKNALYEIGKAVMECQATGEGGFYYEVDSRQDDIRIVTIGRLVGDFF